MLSAAIVFGILLDSFFVIAPVQANAPGSVNTDRSYQELAGLNHPFMEGSRILAKIAKLTTPSVVHILSVRESEFSGTIEETGSGILVESPKSSGIYVVTNRHVIREASLTRISIHLHDGRVIHPIRMWSDPATDIALLKVEADNLTVGRWGNSNGAEIGHAVLAMGSPFGLSRSVTFGIISAKGRRSLKLGSRSRTINTVINQDFLQTDAAINPGNSGGPLINLKGQIIGINTAIASNSGGNDGIGFSIPSNLVRHVVDELLAHGKVARAYLGVTLDSHFDETKALKFNLSRVWGARVIEVHAQTPASQAGLQINDIVLKFNHIQIQDENHLIHLASLTPIGTKIKLLVLRDGKRITIPVLLADRSELEQRSSAPTPPDRREDGIQLMKSSRSIGLKLNRWDPALTEQFGFQEQANGLLVLSIESTQASEDSLQLYDVIVEAARKPVSSVEGFNAILHTLDAKTPVVLKVRRHSNGTTRTRLVILKQSDLSRNPIPENQLPITGPKA